MSKSPRCCLQISFNHRVAECPLQDGDENFLLWKMVLHTEWRWISNAMGGFPCSFPSEGPWVGDGRASGRGHRWNMEGSWVSLEWQPVRACYIKELHQSHRTAMPSVATQVVSVEHAAINIPSPAVSLSLSPILSSSVCSRSVLFFWCWG